MGKIQLIFLLVIVLNLFFEALTQSEVNLYEIKKNSISHPNDKSKNEHGRLGTIRPILELIITVIKTLLEPFKLGLNTAGFGFSIVNKILPEPKGLDINFNGALDEFKDHVKLIAPGTKWCGAGNIAKNSGDLGPDAESDECCKNHDQCPINIAAGKKKYGLKNTGLFTRSACSCDKDFYNCLKKVDSSTSHSVGVTYFNTLGPQCFELVDCSDPNIKCRHWQKNGTQYQWSDNPTF